MKGNNKNTKKGSAEKTEPNIQEKKPEIKEKKEVRRCDQCKWYDVSTQRDFFRRVGKRDETGKRTTIKEIRAVCRSPTSKGKGHLVRNDSDRPCFEKGKYVPPKKPEKAKGLKKEVKEAKTEASLPRRWSNPSAKATA